MVQVGHATESVAVFLGWPTGGTAFDLNEDDVEEVAALEGSVDWLRPVLSNSDDINDTSPLTFGNASKGNELPTLAQSRTESAKMI